MNQEHEHYPEQPRPQQQEHLALIPALPRLVQVAWQIFWNRFSGDNKDRLSSSAGSDKENSKYD